MSGTDSGLRSAGITGGIRDRAERLLGHARVVLNERTHRTFALPILMFAPTSRCNSRCVSCDWWRTDGASDLSRSEVQALAVETGRLRTRLVVFTGGEPLVRPDVFELADLFRAQGPTLHLLTSGLALEKLANEVVERFSGVTVSLDGDSPELYRRIRGVDGLGAIGRGVRRLRELHPGYPVRARATLHKLNYRRLPQLIDRAMSLGLDQISFLSADVSSPSFGREPSATRADADAMLLNPEEALDFERVMDEAIRTHAREFREGRIAESPQKLKRLGRYYQAHAGQTPFPRVECNAPWASAVVEADGTVRPCFFQPSVGNVRHARLTEILGGEMVRFRRTLRVAEDPTCQRCVCSLKLNWRSKID